MKQSARISRNTGTQMVGKKYRWASLSQPGLLKLTITSGYWALTEFSLALDSRSLWYVSIPALVIRTSAETFCPSQGNWWFGSRRKTKDGVFTQTATNFWKGLTETSDVDDVVLALSRATEWETTTPMSSASSLALRTLEKNVEAELGARLLRMRQQFKRVTGELDARWDSLVLLYAHLLRLPIEDPAVQKRTPSLEKLVL